MIAHSMELFTQPYPACTLPTNLQTVIGVEQLGPRKVRLERVFFTEESPDTDYLHFHPGVLAYRRLFPCS